MRLAKLALVGLALNCKRHGVNGLRVTVMHVARKDNLGALSHSLLLNRVARSALYAGGQRCWSTAAGPFSRAVLERPNQAASGAAYRTGGARRWLQPGVRLLRPEEQLFEAMTKGWRHQQLARHLAFETIDARVRMVARFQAFTNSYPWQWSPADFEEWVQELRSKGQARSTLRTSGWAVRAFLGFVCDPVYGWAEECTARFGAHPVQICSRWNTISHLVDTDGRPARRSLTRRELQDLFDAADEDVARARRLGRKGWLSLFRDATLFKVAYAWGLRRQEVRRLEVCDFGVNPKAPEFGTYGACYVRFAKGAHGSGPRRRTVLTVMPWSVDIVSEWVERVRREYQPGVNQALWPSERSLLVSEHQLNARFADLRDRIGLAPGIGTGGWGWGHFKPSEATPPGPHQGRTLRRRCSSATGFLVYLLSGPGWPGCRPWRLRRASRRGPRRWWPPDRRPGPIATPQRRRRAGGRRADPGTSTPPAAAR